ncbi:MAG: flagellar motor switch protein FliN/FliY [Chlamydiales bacterium]|jgi:flagellar motor switch protein FliN/FliY
MDDLSPEEIESLSEAMDGAEEGGADDIDIPADLTETTGEAEESVAAESPATAEVDDDPIISHAQFLQLEEDESVEDLPTENIERMYDVKVKLEVVLGKSTMTLSQILKLQNGSVVELNRLAGEPVDIMANGKLIARAEIVVIDNNFGIKIIDIAGTQQKFAAMKG